MKLITSQAITGVTASSANSGYTAANVLDDKPSKVWLSLSPASTLTLATSGACQALAIFNTNARSVSADIWAGSSRISYQSFTLDYDRLWVDFTRQTSPLTIILSFLSANSDPIYAGVVRCGDILPLPGPNEDFKASRDDQSIRYTMSDGSLQQYAKARPRTQQYTTTLTNAEAASLDVLYESLGQDPIPWDPMEDADDPMYYIGLYHMIDPPGFGRKYRNRIDTSINLREAV